MKLIIKLSFTLVLLFGIILLACFYPKTPQQDVTPVILLINQYPLTDESKAFFKRINPYGFLLSIPFHLGMQPTQLRAELEEVLGRDDFLFFLDQEGGIVNRLKNFDSSFQSPAAQKYGDLAKQNLEHAILQVRLEGERTAKFMKELSIDVAFAPMADFLDYDQIAGRARYYSKDPQITKALADAFAEGLDKGGATPCYKHFPGFSTLIDPHHNTPLVYSDIATIKKRSFPAFEKARKYGCLMPAHTRFVSLDKENISTYSPTFYQFIRESFNFNGIIITDALNMLGAGGPHVKTVGERMNKALAAGADVVIPLFPFHESIENMEDKIRQIEPQYIKRFQTRKHLLKRKK